MWYNTGFSSVASVPQQTNQGNIQMQVNQNICFVRGIEAARSYFVSPGQKIILMDSEKDCFYIKAVDPSGFPYPLRIFDYTERVEKAPKLFTNEVSIQCVTREDVYNIVQELLDSKKGEVEDVEPTV